MNRGDKVANMDLGQVWFAWNTHENAFFVKNTRTRFIHHLIRDLWIPTVNKDVSEAISGSDSFIVYHRHRRRGGGMGN